MFQQLLAISSLVTFVLGEIRGVSPENQDLYKPIIENGKQYWRCLNDSSIRLTYDQINDNFCDCPDGSDEPGTNACPSPPFKFYCANKGHFPNFIDQFKVDDGVCDYDVCCDGSDEQGICEDKCEIIHRQYEQYKTQLESFINDALKKKQSLIELAQGKRKQLVNELRKLEAVLPLKKSHLYELEVQLENSNEQETSVFDVLGDHISDLATKLEAHKRDLLKQESRIQSLEKLLAKLSQEYNPNFNDPAVKESIHKYQEYLSNKDEDVVEDIKETNAILLELSEKAKSLVGNTDSTPLQPTIRNMLHHYFQLFTNTFLTKPQLQVKTTLSNDQLINLIDKQKQEISKIESKIDDIKKNLSNDYGFDDILRAFDLTTINKKLGGYTYRINLLHSVAQDDVLIGNYKKYENGKIYFDRGAKCWNGPQRSAIIEFECGKGLDLVSVSEPEKCSYKFIIKGEAWCHSITEQEIQNRFRINYDLL